MQNMRKLYIVMICRGKKALFYQKMDGNRMKGDIMNV